TDVIPKTTKDFGEILYTDGYPTGNKLLQPYLALMDDDIQVYNGPTIADNQAAVFMNAGAFQWQPDFIEVCARAGSPDKMNFNSWRSYYQLILGTNVALQYLDNSIGSNTEKAMYKGEAYALRAFYHFMLVNLYAKPYNDSTTTPDKSPGIPLKLDANLSESFPARNTVKEVYAQVTQDLDSAIYLLDQVKSDQQLYRFSHVAAHLLASRVYLYMEQWDKVIEHADYVLSYHPQLMDLNDWGGEADASTKPVIGAYNIETIWYYGSVKEQTPAGGDVCYDVSHDLANCYEANDLRTLIYFVATPSILKIFIPNDFVNRKMTDPYGAKADMGSSWRSSEAYLNRAEAYIQKYKTKGDAGAAAEALNSLNTLRARRIDKASFANWTLQTPDVLLEMCRTERRRELSKECGHRWFDLRRYGMPAIKHIFTPDINATSVYELQARDPQYVIPIPTDVLQRNMSLMQNQQVSGVRLPE
ncbi:RagB/SusD family nutrient uptake outer membrane protein, partial [Chitinophaga sp.]|uniref:RagB/SusD family nutrient uptake outer membrane protein n=1 Tax=Chitinophaga sp. TaxID=1869181 RepID=UPI002F93D314